MATGKVDAVFNKTGTVTAVDSGVTISELRCVQKGKVCEVKFYATKSGGFPVGGGASYTAFNVSGIPAPPNNIRTVTSCGAAAYSATSLCAIGFFTSGSIQVSPSVACNCILVDFIYTVE